MKFADHIYLAEAVVYAGLLTEASRFEFILKTYGAKIAAKWEADKAHEPPDVAAAVGAMPGDDEAQKVIGLLMQYDPTPAKKNSNWLANIYCKGGLKLEDLPRVPDYIARFEEKKKARQLPPEYANIERFKSLNDLWDVVRDAEQTQTTAVASKEQEMLGQCDIAYDGPDYLVVKPKTQEAAAYYGGDTEWCTAWGCPGTRHPTRGSQYSYYAGQGPLWIIIDRKSGDKWQFHFETGSFMDVNDRTVDLGKFFDKHPKLLPILGERNFVKKISTIGLRHFSPEVLAEIAAKQPDLLTGSIHNLGDWRALPEEAKTPELVSDLIHRRAGMSFIPVAYWKDRIDEFLAERPLLIRSLPKRYLTQERVDAALDGLRARTGALDWHVIADIPEQFWSDQTRRDYWRSRALDHYQNLHIKDVPAAYMDEQLARVLLVRYPDDIPANLQWLNERTAGAIFEKSAENAIHLPVEFLTQAMLVKAFDAYRNSSSEKANKVLDHFPSRLWTKDVAQWYITHRKLPFAKLPENFRSDTELMVKLASRGDGAELKHIPGPDLSQPVVIAILAQSYEAGVKAMIKYHPDLVNDATLVPAIKKASLPDWTLKAVPKQLMTPAVIVAFANRRVMPLDRIPADLLTPEMIIERGGHEEEELKSVPAHFWNEELAEQLVRRSPDTVAYFPSQVLTEGVLHAFLQRVSGYSGYYYGGAKEKALKNYERFPKSAQSPRNLALAMRNHLVPAEMGKVPKRLLNDETALALVVHNPKLLKKLPEQFRADQSFLAKAVSERLQVLDQLKPEDISEPVAFAAMEKFAHSRTHDQYDGASRSWKYKASFAKELGRIPRDVWSKRVWEAAVGFVAPLKDVPEEYRTPDLVQAAVVRDPSNLRDIADPAAYFREHKIGFSGLSKELQGQFESHGLLLTKKGPENVKDLPREPLNGGSAAVVMGGPVNKRLYVFNDDDVQIARLFTHKGKVYMPTSAEAAKPYAALLLQVAKKFLRNFDMHDLNKVGVYDEGYAGLKLETELEKVRVGQLYWTSPKHLGEKMHTAYLKDGDGDDAPTTPILRIWDGVSKGAFGGGGNKLIEDCTVLDWAAVIEHSEDIVKFFRKERIGGQNPWVVRDLGLYYPKGGNWETILQTKVGRGGSFTIWRGDKKVAATGPKGVLATGIIRANGSVDKISFGSRWGVPDKVKKIAPKIEELLKKFGPAPTEKKAKPPTLAQLHAKCLELAIRYRPDWDNDAIRATIANMDRAKALQQIAELERRIAGNIHPQLQ